ncbi:MAG: acyl-CoA/acyl-ACP dehydrogenase [Chloroflexi bacterium]|nr:acyl-CoA/acyl-ACP dehydrogenase [Chloroflexota bacterium]
MLIQDPQFGKIVDFDYLRRMMRRVYDRIFPEFQLLSAMHMSTELFDDDPSYLIAAGASMLAYQLLLAADEHELAEKCKDGIFTLGWTEEHSGSDLLSVRTTATPIPGDSSGRQYHIKGQKWLINNSYHGDYHIVVAKIDPTQDGPRSLSLFLVPRSSTHSWERLPAHVLENMVLTKYQIDGPGTLLGKAGHGLSIIQRMAMPSKYQCTYVGVQMLKRAVPPAIEHLAKKKIFGDHPLNFNNVFRQMYNISLQAAFYDFVFHRAMVFNGGSFLQFHGTMLKSWLLLRINELLGKNLLVAGSKGFLKESWIGKAAIDSFILPVFDGHYTINTFMSEKHAERYLSATQRIDPAVRVEQMRRELFVEINHNEINAKPSEIRKPEFFDYAQYIEDCALPLDIQPRTLLTQMRTLLNEIEERDLGNDPDYRYKVGDLLHWFEALLASVEFWKVTADDNYLNVVVQQFNGLANTLNTIISEGGLTMQFLQPLRQLPMPKVENVREYLMRLLDVPGAVQRARQPLPQMP